MPTKPTLIRLDPEIKRKPFDCGNSDLNDFFHIDSKHHARQLLTITYALQKGTTMAYFSVLNDSIRESQTTKSKFKKISKEIPPQKRYKAHPAVKIGRFAVATEHQSQGIGTALIDYIKGFFIKRNKTGCRFITVDAYAEAVTFYERNGFDLLTAEDEGKDRRQMYFDLYPLSKVIGV